MIDDAMGNADDATIQELLALANAWGAAIVSNDADAIGRFMTDDWVIVSETGVSPKQHFLSFVESGDLTHDAMHMVEGTARVRVYGDTAVLTGRVTNRANYKGETFDANEWTTDVFRRIDGEWKCVLSHITPVKTTV
jgi:ketosteroid isomerase-like protein